MEGYAAVFYRKDDPGTEFELWDGTYERIGRKAFDRAISEQHDVRGLFNHDANQVLGRTASGSLELKVRSRGLFYSVELADTSLARDVHALIERGDVSGSSFAFYIRGEKWAKTDDGRHVRTITDVDLIDVGPVTFPAYASSQALARAQRHFDHAESEARKQVAQKLARAHEVESLLRRP